MGAKKTLLSFGDDDTEESTTNFQKKTNDIFKESRIKKNSSRKHRSTRIHSENREKSEIMTEPKSLPDEVFDENEDTGVNLQSSKESNDQANHKKANTIRQERRFIRETWQEVDQFMKYTEQDKFSSSSGVDDDDDNIELYSDKNQPPTNTSLDTHQHKSKLNVVEEDEDEELKQWEYQQIMKGVNNFKHLSSSTSATESERSKSLQLDKVSQTLSHSNTSNIHQLRQKLVTVQERYRREIEGTNANLKKLTTSIKEFSDSKEMHDPKEESQNQARREESFMFFQQVRYKVAQFDVVVRKIQNSMQKLDQIITKSVSDSHKASLRLLRQFYDHIKEQGSAAESNSLILKYNNKCEVSIDSGMKQVNLLEIKNS